MLKCEKSMTMMFNSVTLGKFFAMNESPDTCYQGLHYKAPRAQRLCKPLVQIERRVLAHCVVKNSSPNAGVLDVHAYVT